MLRAVFWVEGEDTMELNRIMIVDDEEDFRLGVIKKMDWESIGFEVVGDASNGQDALDLVEQINPDVIITDIKMPFMNGLTLTKKIHEWNPSIKIIILSGFDDFEYAKTAIKYGVSEYLLKPIQASELKEVLVKVKNEICDEVNEKRNKEILHRHYIENLPIIREKFLVNLIEGRLNQNQITKLSELYELILEAPYFAVSIAYAQSEGQSQDNYYESELMTLSFRNIVEEHVVKQVHSYTFVYLDYVIVIAMVPTKEAFSEFIHIMNQVCHRANRILGLKISAGIGSAYDNILKLADSYQEAKKAIEYKVLLGDELAIFIEDVEPKVKSNFSFEEMYTAELIHNIKLGKEEELTRTIDTILVSMKAAQPSLQEYRACLMELVSSVYKLSRLYQLNQNEIFGENFDIYVDVFKFSSFDTLGQWLHTICNRLRHCIRHERKDSAKLIVQRSVQLINEQYGNSELSVEVLCDNLNISQAYFSTIFKKELGVSFVSYLTMVRMEKAVDLLNSTDEKTYIIAEKIGYIEPNYFSYVFKKYYGVSPTKFRKIDS